MLIQCGNSIGKHFYSQTFALYSSRANKWHWSKVVVVSRHKASPDVAKEINANNINANIEEEKKDEAI